MAGVGAALRGFGKALKKQSKARKSIRKLPFGDFIDYPIEVITKQKKPAAVGAGAAITTDIHMEKKKKKKKKEKK